jgi:hypothetical protein
VREKDRGSGEKGTPLSKLISKLVAIEAAVRRYPSRRTGNMKARK